MDSTTLRLQQRLARMLKLYLRVWEPRFSRKLRKVILIQPKKYFEKYFKKNQIYGIKIGSIGIKKKKENENTE